MIIGTFISTLILYIINKFKNKNIYTIIEDIYYLLVILICLMILRIFITSFYLTKTPGLVISIPFIILCIYNSKSGLNSIKKEAKILLIPSIIIILLNVIGASKTGSINSFLPIFTTSKNNIIKGIIFYVSFIVSPQFLIKENKIDNKKYLKSFIIYSLIIDVIGIFTIYTLGPKLIKIYRFPEFMILKEISLFNFIENVENLVGLVWFFNIFITSSLSVYHLNSNIKNNIILFVLLSTITLTCEFVSDKYTYALFIYNALPYILLSFIIIFIFFCLIKKR